MKNSTNIFCSVSPHDSIQGGGRAGKRYRQINFLLPMNNNNNDNNRLENQEFLQ